MRVRRDRQGLRRAKQEDAGRHRGVQRQHPVFSLHQRRADLLGLRERGRRLSTGPAARFLSRDKPNAIPQDRRSTKPTSSCTIRSSSICRKSPSSRFPRRSSLSRSFSSAPRRIATARSSRPGIRESSSSCGTRRGRRSRVTAFAPTRVPLRAPGRIFSSRSSPSRRNARSRSTCSPISP